MQSGSLRFQLDIPVEIVTPALVQVVGRKCPAVLLQLPGRWANGLAVRVHVSFAGRSAALAQIAWSAGGRDILPRRATALGARNHVVEGKLARGTAINATEFVPQEQVEPGERGIFVGTHIIPKSDDARELQRHTG